MPMITKKDIPHFKNKLEKEKAILEDELNSVGRKDPNNPSDWQATSHDDTDSADENEVADKMEELNGNNTILEQLEPQLNEVKSALEKIEKGTYGICEVCGGGIEKERAEANPSARTCMKDMRSDKIH